MSQVQKQKQHPIRLRLEAQQKSKSASLPTRPDSGGAGNAVKGQDERQKRAPLTASPARCPRALFLHLTPDVVVIHGMTWDEVAQTHANLGWGRRGEGYAKV